SWQASSCRFWRPSFWRPVSWLPSAFWRQASSPVRPERPPQPPARRTIVPLPRSAAEQVRQMRAPPLPQGR
ncbi:Mercury transporter, partial [Dysosmobacter welbionis]